MVELTDALDDLADRRVGGHSVGDLLHRTARRDPDKLAVVAGELRVTYAEFDVAVNRTAHALAAKPSSAGGVRRSVWML